MDDADRAQEQIEFFEQHRHRPDTRKHVVRFDDTCADCGDPIEPNRIRVIPNATRCIECENFYQHMRKRNDV